ncbi:hypothetical protein A5715_00640 [Mycolicibacter heraklionensis]|nr:hypothetical protein A5715_00640 [Mycolicibacter heraklionensis]
MLADAVQHTVQAGEDVVDLLAELPTDSPDVSLFAVADIVGAKAHIAAAHRLLTNAADTLAVK